MKRKFTCRKCGKQGTFDTEKVTQQRSLMERVGSQYELVAYFPKCRYCGQENNVEPSRRRGRPRMSNTRNRIEINAKVMLGKPVIRGTRIPVELILRKLSEGATEAELRDAYPKLKPKDVRAVLAYAADAIAHEETMTL